MELFSEIYNCYFQIVDEICKTAKHTPISEKEMLTLVHRLGYEESAFLLMPKLINDWNLLEKTEEGYLSKIALSSPLPLTMLQKKWLKSLLADKRIRLFLDEQQCHHLNQYLEDVEPLFLPENFYYYDQFQNGDDYAATDYVAHFRTILSAIRGKQLLHIQFSSSKGNEICHTYLPCRIEYSPKNDKFRLLAFRVKGTANNASAGTVAKDKVLSQLSIINLSGIKSITLEGNTYDGETDFTEYLKESFYKEPVKLLITTKRNSLERTMLHFANYKKQTRKLSDDTYECLIYYNSTMETELLIEVLSFGPTIKVLGPENFLKQVKERIIRQQELLERQRSQ